MADYYDVHGYSIRFQNREGRSSVTCYNTSSDGIRRWLWFYFHDPNENLPPDSIDDGDPKKIQIKVHLPASRYSWLVDLLRNEGPSHFAIIKETPVFVQLSTKSVEQVGEGE